MKFSKFIGAGLGLLIATLGAPAVTVEFSDGAAFNGDIVQKTPAFLQLRVDGSYTNLEWAKISQDSLRSLTNLAATTKDKKLEELAAPYIEISQDEIIKKTEVVIKPVPRLERPEKGSLLGAMFHAPLGIICLLLLYAANIYAGYEVAVIRAYPIPMVCGISAIAPVIGPVIFLFMPTKLPAREDEEAEEAEAPSAATAGSHSASYAAPAAGHGAAAPDSPASSEAARPATAAALPQTQVFKRGQFTFNRRFIETKFSNFFGAVRRGDDKDMVLLVKSMRGEHVATRISRIASNDMHLEVHKGTASQEVQMPFAEIQEIHLKHKDA